MAVRNVRATLTLIVLCLLAVPTPGSPEPPELTDSASSRAPGELGACTSAAECGPGFGCFEGGRCLCAPGRDLCGSTCADISSDPLNCGRCGTQCSESCDDGRCTEAPSEVEDGIGRLQQAVTKSTFRVSADDGTSVCRRDSEAAPERAAFGSDVHYFVAHNNNNNNWADVYNSWGTTYRSTPPGTNSFWTTTVVGDPSATTSDFTGLNYLGYIGKRNVDTTNCVGIAASSSDQLDNNVFSYDGGLTCLLAGHNVDGPTIEYDRGGTDLYAAYVNSAGGQHWLLAMKGCKGGSQPGCCANDGSACPSISCVATATETCPVTSRTAIASFVHDQPTLAVNPCSHNAVVAYKLGNNEVRMQIRTPSGVLVKDQLLQSNQAHAGNTGCTNGQVRTCFDGTKWCSPTGFGSQPCMRKVARPQVVTASASGKCYAYVAWEYSAAATGGNVFYNDRMEVWDITNDAAPVEKAAWLGKSASGAWNHFGGQLSVNGTNVAWMRYSDNAGACSTAFFAHGDTNSALTSMSDWGAIASGFPSIRTNGGASGFLDWTQTISLGGGERGAMIGVWTQPICMTQNSCESCITANCASDQWSLAIKGVRITP